jgi:hypothetical protein
MSCRHFSPTGRKIVDATLTGSNGRTYHLWPHERWWVDRFLPKVQKSESPKTLLRRSGYPATVLRIGGMASSMVSTPLSLALFIATWVDARHHPVTPTPYIINILIYLVLAGPFFFLLYRRRFQSGREARAYRSAAPEPSGD